jgi:hypothetical protein
LILRRNNAIFNEKYFMKVHLVRSEEYPRHRFKTITEILNKFPGPVKFIFRDEDIAEEAEDEETDYNKPGDYGNRIGNEIYGNILLDWDEHFRKCEEFRVQNKKVKPYDLVVLFTDYGNKPNWFSAWDPSGKMNFFIQTSRWDQYIEARSCYPIIYELATIPLIISTWENLEDIKKIAHKVPRGCPLDYCHVKQEIELRLRTGDVCPDCLEEMKRKNIDAGLARQVFTILDHVRDQVLFRRHFGITGQLSRINIEIENSTIIFTDIGNIPVKLPAREMAFYLFFLWHPEGVEFRNLNRHYEELRNIYKRFSMEVPLPKFENSLVNMTKNELPNSKSWLVNSIKEKLEYTIGEEIAPFYIISRKPARRKGEFIHFIGLDRSLVTIDQQSFNPLRQF